MLTDVNNYFQMQKTELWYHLQKLSYEAPKLEQTKKRQFFL